MNNIDKKYIYTLLILIFSLPFLLVSYDYQDDIFRSNSGDSSFWLQNARPLSVILLQLLNQGAATPDLFPLTTICTFIILGYVAAKIVEELKVDNPLLNIAFFCILLANPFFLQNLSYKYDAITMVVSLWLSYLFVFKTSKLNQPLRVLVKSLIVFSILCLYQPTLAFLFGLIILQFNVGDINNKFKIKVAQFAEHIVLASVSFIIYKLTIADIFLNDGYQQMSKIIEFNAHSLTLLIDNVYGYLRFVKLFIKKPLILLALIILLASYIFCLSRKKLGDNLVSCISLCMLIVALTSSNILLKFAQFNLREMVGFSLFFLFIAYNVISTDLGKKIVVVFGFTLFYTCFALSCSLFALKNAVHFRDTLIVNDVLNAMEYYGTTRIERITFINDTLDLLPKQTALIRSNPLLVYLMPNINFKSDWYASAILNQQYHIQKKISHAESLPGDLRWRQNCYTKTALKEKTLFIEVGIFCN